MKASTKNRNAVPDAPGCRAFSQALALAAGCMLAAGAAAQAATATDGAPPSGAKTGQQIATTGDPGKGVVACVTCHGARGEGNPASGFPRLAGQSAAYLNKQLDSYADGRRQNAVMAPIAKGLSEDERRAVSAYYADMHGAAAPASQPDAAPAGAGTPPQQPRARKRAETLYMTGDEALRVQGCANCHGPGGAGEPPDYPYLAGQHAGYIAGALREFKSGARTNDPTGQMPYIAKQLSDSDIDALAAYLAQLPAPSPSEGDMAEIRQRAARGAATPSPRQSGPSAPTGTGTEQGAPLTGGGQSPGGGGGGSGSGPSGGR
jgi:cytochrome c553